MGRPSPVIMTIASQLPVAMGSGDPSRPHCRMSDSVLACIDLETGSLEALLGRYGLRVRWMADGDVIPGSFWGEPEAGLVRNALFVRPDTPVHSALHEACHYVCMDCARRGGLHTDAGGDYDEENAVCYLQLLLSDRLPGVGRERLCRDMDAWGYSFRLGSAAAWLRDDAEDARDWLRRHALIDACDAPTWRLRETGGTGPGAS